MAKVAINLHPGLEHYDAIEARGFIASITKEACKLGHTPSFRTKGLRYGVIVWAVRGGWRVAKATPTRFFDHETQPDLLAAIDRAEEIVGVGGSWQPK